MKANLLRQRSYLVNYFREKGFIHKFLFSNDFRAKVTLKIADIADFNINFFKPLNQDRSPLEKALLPLIHA